MSRIDEKRSLETSRGVVDYMTIDLIKQIERHPVIWDRLHQDYKSGEAKSVAWHAIGRVFVPFYDDIDEDEQGIITESLKNRWRNCVGGLMSSVTMKRKNDRLFCPFKYTREMKFYLEMRGMKLSDIYDEQESEEIEEIEIKKESKVEEDDEEIEEDNEEEKKVTKTSSKNKKNKTADTSTTFRSARLREKQTVLEKSSPEKKTSTPKNTKQKPSKIVQPVPIVSVSHSLEENNASNDVPASVEENIDEDDLPYNYIPQPKKAKTSAAVNHSVNDIPQNSHQPLTFTNETEAADQAFFDSIKPALRKMSETQKLDFQIDILQILKTFRTN